MTALSGPKWRNWQTRQIQGLVPARVSGFESPLRHQPSRTFGRAASLIRLANALPSLRVRCVARECVFPLNQNRPVLINPDSDLLHAPFPSLPLTTADVRSGRHSAWAHHASQQARLGPLE